MQGKSRALLGLVAVVMSTTAGCAGSSDAKTGDLDNSFGIQDSQLNIADLTSHHDHVGPISGTTLTGQHLTVTPGGGKVLVVNFWGDWCAPCNAEEPGFAQVASDDKSKDVSFLGVAEKEQGTADALDFERKFAVPYPSLNDTDGSIQLGFPTSAIPSTTPTTLVLDKSGDVVAKVTGIIEYTQLNELINHVLGAKT